MKIGWFGYHPDMIDPTKPHSASGRSWVSFLYANYAQRGHKVIWLPKTRPAPGSNVGFIEQCDVAYFQWRWEMLDYPERNALYLEQWELIEKGYKTGIKMVVHDQDHMMTPADYAKLIKMGVTLTAPELFPKKGFKTLHFPNPFTKPIPIRGRSPFMEIYEIVYIGNVYGRAEAAADFLNTGLRTKVIGNWLEEGPDRPGPEKIRQLMPKVEFAHRITSNAVVEGLAQGTCTIHLHKPSYGPLGFMTMRWAEAAAACTPAFIPYTFALPNDFQVGLANLGMIVTNGEDLLAKFRKLTEAEWILAITLQRDFVNANMSLEPWLNLKEL